MSWLIRDVTRSIVRTSVRKQSVKAATSFTEADLQNARPFQEIPGPTGIRNIPYIGAIFYFKPFGDSTPETLHPFFNSMVEKYGTLVRCNLPGKTVLLADPAGVEVVMKNEGQYPYRPSVPIVDLYAQHYNRFTSMANLQGAEWHAWRTVLNRRMMNTKSAQHYLTAQNEVANTLVERLKEDRSAKELDDLFYRYACESIAVVVFNERLGYLDHDIDQYPERLQPLVDIKTTFDALFRSVRVPPFILKNFNLKVKQEYFEAKERISKLYEAFYQKVIDDIKIKQAEGNLEPEENNFMLSLLMTDKLSPDVMASITVSLFIAGTDSTAKNLQMALYNLARNPDKQEKLYKEIMNAIGRHGNLSANDLSQMPYLLACVKESMRVFSPLPGGTQRTLPSDIILRGYRIPAGTSIFTLSGTTGKLEKYFPNAHAFLPERWLRDDTGQRETPIPPMAAHPFGFGRRQCIGKRFAEQEIYLALLKILQNFQVSLASDQKELDIMHRPFVTTKDPIKFVFKYRE